MTILRTHLQPKKLIIATGAVLLALQPLATGAAGMVQEPDVLLSELLGTPQVETPVDQALLADIFELPMEAESLF